jgi:integrase/recombinase XerD
VFLLNTGFRVSEVCDAKKEDIVFNVEMPYILVTGKGKKTKKDKGKIIEIPEPNRQKDQQEIPTAYLDRLKEIYDKADEYLFTRDGRSLHRGWVWKYIKRAIKECGLNPRYSTHTLRHFACTKYQEITGDIELTRNFARHKSVNTTQRYAKAAAMVKKRKKALDNFEVEE